MKNILKICDIYGTEFHWYFDYKQKYYTYHGGIFSILSFFAWISILVIFGFEDFKREQSISSITNIPPSGDKIIKFGKQKLYIPWRIMDYGDTFINHIGILHPRIFYFTNKFNNKTQLMETNYKILNYSLCNETSMKDLGKDYLLHTNLDKLYCIDMDDLDMGGSWNSKFINYIRLDLNLCKGGINYSDNNTNCTKPEYLTSLYGEGNNWFFELLYPTIQFQPNNKKIPLFVLYNSLYYGLNTNSNKVDRVYLQENIFKDEKGWIFARPIRNRTYWGVSSIKSDFYTIGDRDIFKYGSTSRLYSLKLYLDYSSVLYTRKYKKLYEIFSEIFPVMKAISMIFSIISETINKLKVCRKLNEFIIDDKIYRTNTILDKNIKSKIIREDQDQSSVSKKKLKDSSKLICLNVNSNNIKMKLNNVKENGFHEEPFNKTLHKTVNVGVISLGPFEMFNKDKSKFPFIYYFFGFLLNKISSNSNNNYMCISEKFNKSFTFFTHLIDITSYISLYQQFESLKKLVLNNIKYNKCESSYRKLEGETIHYRNRSYDD
jgi:hypothetical protein